MRRADKVLLVVAITMLSTLADSRAKVRVVTGRVTGFEVGRFISVTNDQTDPTGFRIVLRETTAILGDPGAIERGIWVTVSYRNIGERAPVADEVRLLMAPTMH